MQGGAHGARRLRAPRLLLTALSLCCVWGAPRASAEPRATTLDPQRLEQAFAKAAALPRLQALIVARGGVIEAERRFRGPSLDAPVNIKSVSKSVVSTLVGIAIAQGKLRGVDQPIGPFFTRYLKRQPDPRVAEITIGQLLSMQSGLVRTSGPAYGSWVASRNWVEYILTRPLMSEPNGPMVYSTGNSHLLSAVLTAATGRSTYDYARTQLAKPLGIALRRWTRDPQGIYFGGNQMRLSAHALVQFGELYRNRGKAGDRQIVPETWVEASWTPRTRSIFSGQLYGYGWFIARVNEHPLYYAWGYGGQFVFVIPDLELVVVATSAANGPRDFEHLGGIYGLLVDDLVPAAEAAARKPSG